MVSTSVSNGEDDEGSVEAHIVGIHQETPSVKRFTFKPHGPMQFIPGQWVDFMAPGVPAVGGFSLTSTPLQLEACGTFELAVKRSRQPTAAWLHYYAQAGDKVIVRVDGDFHYQPGDEWRPLLVLAGGIGINPLLAQLKHCFELREGPHHGRHRYRCNGSSSDGIGSHSGSSSDSSYGLQEPAAGAAAAPPGGHHASHPHAAVLYSASEPAELAFRHELESMQRRSGGTMWLRLHATAAEWRWRDAEWGGHSGRIGRHELHQALQWLSSRCSSGLGGSSAVAAGLATDAGGSGGAQAIEAGGTAVANSGAAEGTAAASSEAAEGTAAASSRAAQGSAAAGPAQGDAPPGAASAPAAAAGEGPQGGLLAVPPQLVTLLCGPSRFEDHIIQELLSLGVRQDQIRYERWW